MNRRTLMQTMGAAAVVPFVTGRELEAETGGAGHVAGAVFELRTYHCFEGKLPLLLERFRSKETKIFARMGMHGVGYWTPTDEPLAGKTLVYLLRHKSREAATASWAKFKDDAEWVKLKAESEAGGPFVERHESTFMTLTDFSPAV